MNKKIQPAYNKIVGTGGLGVGVIYQMDGNHPIGKSESRKAFLQPYQDFCKIHIILHYVSKLIQDLSIPVPVFPISGLGVDANGNKILNLLEKVGMKLDLVKSLNDRSTLSCICQNYPDGSSSNITEGASACDTLNENLFPEIKTIFDAKTLFVAAPEVPIEFRQSLLQKAKYAGAFTLASYTSGEIKNTPNLNFDNVNVLLLNYDETCAFLAVEPELSIEELLQKIPQKLHGFLNQSHFIFTNSKEGVYHFHKKEINKLTPHAFPSKNTAGAGDAFFSGILFGLLKGCSIFSSQNECAMGWGLLFSRISVESTDTIAFDFNLQRLNQTSQSLQETTYIL
jgi:sugar/nucleoside kinase (ribokinase family)